MKGPNLVTPDDTGKRVTFQYELPNGFVGEAVGMLEYYDQGAATFVVRRKDGTVARISVFQSRQDEWDDFFTV